MLRCARNDRSVRRINLSHMDMLSTWNILIQGQILLCDIHCLIDMYTVDQNVVCASAGHAVVPSLAMAAR